jgi:hypothetical protein
MPAGRSKRNAKPLANLFECQSVPEEPQHLYLPRGEGMRSVPCGTFSGNRLAQGPPTTSTQPCRSKATRRTTPSIVARKQSFSSRKEPTYIRRWGLGHSLLAEGLERHRLDRRGKPTAAGVTHHLGHRHHPVENRSGFKTLSHLNLRPARTCDYKADRESLSISRHASELTDEQWSKIEPIIPKRKPSRKDGRK